MRVIEREKPKQENYYQTALGQILEAYRDKVWMRAAQDVATEIHVLNEAIRRITKGRLVLIRRAPNELVLARNGYPPDTLEGKGVVVLTLEPKEGGQYPIKAQIPGAEPVFLGNREALMIHLMSAFGSADSQAMQLLSENTL